MRTENESTFELVSQAEKCIQQTIERVEKGQSCTQSLVQLVYIRAILVIAGHQMIWEQLRRSERIISQDPSPEKRCTELNRLVELYRWSKKLY